MNRERRFDGAVANPAGHEERTQPGDAWKISMSQPRTYPCTMLRELHGIRERGKQLWPASSYGPVVAPDSSMCACVEESGGECLQRDGHA